MYLNGYGVSIDRGEEFERDGAIYVKMNHNQQYSLQILNNTNSDSAFYVEIDGKNVGGWVVNRNQTVYIDRPLNDNGIFTFYRLNTSESYQAGIQNNENTGLIKVTFYPEKIVPVMRTRAGVQSLGFDEPISKGIVTRGGNHESFGAGGTGLSGQSNTKYGPVTTKKFDESRGTVLMLRLVERVVNYNQPRELQSVYPKRFV